MSTQRFSSSQKATCSNASRSKSASSSRLSTLRTFLLNSAVTPGGVVVGGLQRLAVLDQVGAEQEVVLRPEQVRDPGQEARRAAAGSKLPIVPPRKAITRGPESGMRSRSRSKSQTRPWTSIPYSEAIASAVSRVICSEMSTGRVGLEAAGLAHRVEEHPGLARRAGAELDQRRGAVRRRRRSPAESRSRIARSAAGRVVLGQLGDLPRTAPSRARRRSSAARAP